MASMMLVAVLLENILVLRGKGGQVGMDVCGRVVLHWHYFI